MDAYLNIIIIHHQKCLIRENYLHLKYNMFEQQDTIYDVHKCY